MTTEDVIMALAKFRTDTVVFIVDEEGKEYRVKDIYESYGGAVIVAGGVGDG